MKQVRKSSHKQLLLKGQKPPSRKLEIIKVVAGSKGDFFPQSWYLQGTLPAP